MSTDMIMSLVPCKNYRLFKHCQTDLQARIFVVIYDFQQMKHICMLPTAGMIVSSASEWIQTAASCRIKVMCHRTDGSRASWRSIQAGVFSSQPTKNPGMSLSFISIPEQEIYPRRDLRLVWI